MPETKKKFYSAFAKKKTAKDDNSDSEDDSEKKSKTIWTGLKRKTADLVHQVLRTPLDKKQGIAEMRWEKFVKVRSHTAPWSYPVVYHIFIPR